MERFKVSLTYRSDSVAEKAIDQSGAAIDSFVVFLKTIMKRDKNKDK